MAQIFLGPCQIDPDRREVRCGTTVTRLEPKAFAVLDALIGADGAPVSRAALLDICWPPGEGSDQALTQVIGQLRRALGEDGRLQRMLRTIPKKGYVLAADEDRQSQEDRPWRYTFAVTPLRVAVTMLLFVLFSLVLIRLHPGERRTIIIKRAPASPQTSRP
jgi:DNA-binding winged helix-turn-helix (wHTH) protein